MTPAVLAELELQASYPRGIAARVDSADLALLMVEWRELKAALLAVSPWKLQDCWCAEDDCGGAKKHSAPCLLARAALAKAGAP